MRAYYMDNDPSDQRLPHDSGRAVSDETLDALGVLRWHIPVDPEGKWQSQVDAIAEERHYKNRDVCLVTKEGMGEQFEANLKKFYSEYVPFESACESQEVDGRCTGICTRTRRSGTLSRAVVTSTSGVSFVRLVSS